MIIESDYKVIMLKKLTLALSLITLSAQVLAEADTKLDKLQPKAQVESALKTTPALVKNDTKAVDELVKKLEAIKTLSAGFSQEMRGSNGRKQMMSGTLSIKRPDLFVWHTEQPYSQSIYARDSKVWSIDHDLMQVVIQNQGRDTENTPAQLLSGNAREFLKNYYVIVEQQRDEQSFVLRPAGNNALFESLTLHFQKGELAGFSMVDSLGNHRRIDLKGVDINQPVSDSRFKADYPKNYDVIDESAVSKKVG